MIESVPKFETDVPSENSLYEAMKNSPGVEATQLGLDVKYFDINGKDLAKLHAFNPKEGVAQTLGAVISAGQELFAVVKSSARDDYNEDPNNLTTKYVLTHFGKDGQRAQIVGVLEEGYPIKVGLAHQVDMGFDLETSGNHFEIGVVDGMIAVGDSGSSNGTEVLVSGLVGAPSESTPFDDFNKWAPKSADVKTAVLSTRTGIYVPPKATEEVSNAKFAEQQVVDVNESLRIKESELLQRLDELSKPFSEDVGMLLWKYAAGSMLKREAQRDGYGQQ